jgi:hypothetical protein
MTANGLVEASFRLFDAMLTLRMVVVGSCGRAVVHSKAALNAAATIHPFASLPTFSSCRFKPSLLCGYETRPTIPYK